jgi:hypothetical protein
MTSVVATPLLYSGGRAVAARSHPGKDSSVDIPETRYADSDSVRVAYQVFGDRVVAP